MSETPIFIGSKHKADVSNPLFVVVDGVWIAAINKQEESATETDDTPNLDSISVSVGSNSTTQSSD